MKFIQTSEKKDEAERLKAKLSIIKSNCSAEYIENGWYFLPEEETLISYEGTINIKEEIANIIKSLTNLEKSELEECGATITSISTHDLKVKHSKEYVTSYKNYLETNSVLAEFGVIYGETYMKMQFIFEPFTGTFVPCIPNSMNITEYNDTQYIGYGYLSSAEFIGNSRMVKVLVDIYRIACEIKEKGYNYVTTSMRNNEHYIDKSVESTISMGYDIFKYKDEAIEGKENLYLKYTYAGEKIRNTYKIIKVNLTDRYIDTLDYNEILKKPTIPVMFNIEADVKVVGTNSFMSGYMYELNGDKSKFYTSFVKSPMSNNIVATYIKSHGTAYETQQCIDTWHDTKEVLLDEYGNILIDEDTIQLQELGNGNYKLVWKELVDSKDMTSIDNKGNKLKLSNPYSYKRTELKAALYNIKSGYITSKTKNKNIFMHPKLPIALLTQEATGKVFMCILNQGDKDYIIDEPQNISKYFETQISSDGQTLRFNLDISGKSKIWVYTDIYLNPILLNEKVVESKQYK